MKKDFEHDRSALIKEWQKKCEETALAARS